MRMNLARISMAFLILLGAGMHALAQRQIPLEPPKDMNQRLLEMAVSSKAVNNQLDYHIGPEDLLEVSVFEVAELSRTVRVSASGEISLPLVGAIKVAGLTPVGTEKLLTSMLKSTYVKDPQVSVFLKEFKSDPVSIVGAVKMPGLYTIQTRKSLIEVLAMAQGFTEGPVRQPGRSIIITRKGAADAIASGSASPVVGPGNSPVETSPGIIEVPIKDLLQTGDPKWNVPIYPGDVIKVVPSGTIYVAGAVTRPGGFPLTDFDNVSAIQALSMAGGTTKAASTSHAIIIRRDAVGQRVEQKIDLSRVLKGKDKDSTLGPNDILFVPGSIGKEAAIRGLESALQAATGYIIYHP